MTVQDYQSRQTLDDSSDSMDAMSPMEHNLCNLFSGAKLFHFYILYNIFINNLCYCHSCGPRPYGDTTWNSNNDLNPVDYSVWGCCNRWCRHKIPDTDQLKYVLIDCWAQLSQDMLNRAIDQLPKWLMMVIKVKGAHVCWISSGLTMCVNYRCCFIVCCVKLH